MRLNSCLMLDTASFLRTNPPLFVLEGAVSAVAFLVAGLPRLRLGGILLL